MRDSGSEPIEGAPAGPTPPNHTVPDDGSREGKDVLGLDDRLERLEQVVRELEREDQELDDALRLFEEGVEHVRAAREALSRSELAIERLLEEEGS